MIHLACISNDPSFELNPDLGKSINYDAFFGLVDLSKFYGVHRFVYASSSSVYGIKNDQDVTENLLLEPLTDYSKYKAMCEDVLLAKKERGFTPLILRPATVCGYSPRLRLDLTVNILTNHAVNNRKITVFGGDQKRPNVEIATIPTDDHRSYHISSEKIKRELGYQPQRSIDDAVSGLVSAFDTGLIPSAMDDTKYYNIKVMQALSLK